MHESREARRSFRGRFLFSTKELLFLITVCVTGAFLFSGVQKSAKLLIAWEEMINTRLFENNDFPLDHERLPQPVVSDIDGDGVSEIIMFITDETAKLSLSAFNHKQDDALRLKNTIQLPLAVNSTVRPLALAAGFTKTYNNMVELRQQIVVVLLSDFTVLCYNHKLDLLLWSSKLTHNKDVVNMIIREAAILVTPIALQPSDKGSVIIGGRLSVQSNPLFRKSEQIRDKLNYDSLGHYTVYAVNAKDGAMRWKHEPGDFESTLPYSVEDVSSFQHYKLTLHRTVAHVGEVSWQQYSQSLSRSLPHSWEHNSDTFFQLAHFTKNKNNDPDITDHISKVGMLAKERVAHMMPSPPKQEPLSAPNVLLIHSQKGIEVLHLYQGRPLCTLPLPPLHTSHADIDTDGTIDHVSAVITHPEAGDNQPPTITAGETIQCYGKATKMQSEKVIFKHQICSHLGWLENLINNLLNNIIPKATQFPIKDYIPDLSLVKNTRPAHHLGAEALSPVIVESAHHSGLQLHFSKAATSMHKGTYYDTVFVLNTGRISSIGPHGEINWQVDSVAEWLKGPRDSSANEELFTVAENTYFFLTQTFTPSALAISLTPGGVKDHLLVVGWSNMALFNTKDGQDVTEASLHCPPVNRPVVKDFTNDGFNDVILTCRDRYIGFDLYKESGLWNSTIISVLVGIIILIILHHVRLKFANPFVVVKEAVD